MELLIPSFLLVALLVWREYVHDKRVNGLLDRIQRPDLVIPHNTPDPSGELLHLPFEDEEAYEQARANGEVT